MTLRDETRAGEYARAALESACSEVAGAQPGGRNAGLNSGAFAMGQLAGASMLSRAEAESRLLAAAIECGLPRAEAQATIKSGLDAGFRQPRQLVDIGSRGLPGGGHARVRPGNH